MLMLVLFFSGSTQEATAKSKGKALCRGKAAAKSLIESTSAVESKLKPVAVPSSVPDVAIGDLESESDLSVDFGGTQAVSFLMNPTVGWNISPLLVGFIASTCYACTYHFASVALHVIFLCFQVPVYMV